MRARQLMLFVSAALAGCNSSPTVTATNASASDVAKQLHDTRLGDQLISPGRWESTLTIQEMKMPGLPPEMAEKMKAQMSKARTHVNCLTAADVKRPREDFFAAVDKSCRYDHFTMGGGKIDAVMQCAQGGAKRTMTMNGTYSSDNYTMSVASDGAEAKGNPLAGMSMRMDMKAKRVGACDGTEKDRSAP